MIEFTVPGIPAPQGSKAPYGGEANPRTKPWRAAVSSAASEAMNGIPPLTGPVYLALEFRFLRPKSHYGTGRNAERLKDTAPYFHSSKPDTDKLVRAIGDALTGVAIRDDSQIVDLHALKLYDESAGVTVHLEAAA